MSFHQNTDARHSLFNNVSGSQYNEYKIEAKANGLDKLKPANMDPSRRSACLPDTRTDVLRFITDWVSDTACTQNVLWLHGLAGSGKSTISTTIANYYRNSGQLGAFVFFDRDVAERSNPALVIRTLVYQIGSFQPQIGKLVSAAIEDTPAILLSPIYFQFKRLLIDLWSPDGLPPAQSQVVLVLDALDECDTAEEREALVKVLAEQSVHLPFNVRMIIGSRADIDIRCMFEAQTHILSLELDLNSAVVAHDISSYFRHHMKLIRSKKTYLGMDWPGEDKIIALTERACGLFVWASTAAKFINGHDPQKRLSIILQGNRSFGAESALDILYRTALESVGMWDDEDFVADFRTVIGTVLVLQDPLSSMAIDKLFGASEGRPSIDIITQLACVVSSSPRIRVIHPSFVDFLVTLSRCGRDIWFFRKGSHNRTVTIRCMHHLDHTLRRNMCNLTLSTDLGDEHLPEDLTYACIFWVDHVCAIKEDVQPIMEDLKTFLDRHLLHWFEAMSILRKSREAIKLLDRLADWVTVYSHHRSSVSELVRDASRFARAFATSIEEHPLLVYFSALPFSPTTSTLYRQFHDVNVFPSVSGGFQQSWSPLLLVLSERDVINAVAYSRDGTRIVSGSDDKTIRVWDASSGAEVFSATRTHEGPVRSVAFSPDGTQIATSSQDKSIRVWDGESGAEILVLRGHDGGVNSIAFSPDGTRIVSGSWDKTIRIWDTKSGLEMLSACGHKKGVNSVAFSPDGTRIVSGSRDMTVRVWDASSGTQLIPSLQGHQDAIHSVVFSPDGTRIASGSRDKTIRVWDATSGVEVVPALRGHGAVVHSIAFSADGTQIVSGSGDKTIRFWNAISGTEIPPVLQGHESSVLSVTFSPDDTRIVSASYDETIRIWESNPIVPGLSMLLGHESRVRTVAFSPDGTHIVSGSDDKTIRIWDTRSGAEVLPVLRGHEGSVRAATFSSDGGSIVSGSHDGTIRVWDLKSRTEVLSIMHGTWILSVAFSPDGKLIVSGSNDQTVRAWDSSTGAEVLPMLRQRSGWVMSVAFCPEGTRIVSGSRDGFIGVWNAHSSAEVLPEFRAHEGAIQSVKFSLDGTRIVSISDEKHIRIWDSMSGGQFSTVVECHHTLPSAINITRDGWLVDLLTRRTIFKLPPVTNIDNSCSAAYETSLATGTLGGQVIIMHFPLVVFTSPDTQPVESVGRLQSFLESS